jgi:hypothetical protein
MNSLESIISWRTYLRNRLHRVLQRAGWDRLNHAAEDRGETPIKLLLELDAVQLSHCSSIEQYALKIGEAERVFGKNRVEPALVDRDPVVFSETFFAHFMMIMSFIGSLSEDDCLKKLETPFFSTPINVQWLLEYGNFFEQSITGRIIFLMQMKDPKFRVPWSTTCFLKTVKPPIM